MGHEVEGSAALLRRKYARNTQTERKHKGRKYPLTTWKPSLRQQLSENDGTPETLPQAEAN